MKFKSFISKAIISSLTLSLFFTSVTGRQAFADSFKSVTLGADLSDAQKSEMLKYFEVTKSDANVLEVTSRKNIHI